MSTLIENLNNACLAELNDIWAMVLYKGHNKDRENDRSYRTISTCPLLAKCLDIHIGRRYYNGWKNIQAPTQFQGEGSSHDLASLLLTEVIQQSIFIQKKPLYALFLDAKSAFDVVIKENAIVSAFKAGTKDQGLLYLDARLANRRTFPQWGTTLMGPICDSLGLEQGAVNSDRLYKLCNNSQLDDAQDSLLGVDINGVHVSAIGQADDVVLIANSPIQLVCLLYLTIKYCEQNNVTLVPEKTNLLSWVPSTKVLENEIVKLGCPITIDNCNVQYCDTAEHVGILRSIKGGNMPHILSRISSHHRALSSILHFGAARHHSVNPDYSIYLQKMYGSPVLLSGLASLVLSTAELAAIWRHHRITLCRLQKLSATTPDCVVFFLAGCLPSTALIHLRQLSLLGMVSRKEPQCPIRKIGIDSLCTLKNKKSWFQQVRLICQTYQLPDPLEILNSPPSKESWKRQCKAKIISWWEQKLRGEALLLPSLKYFHPHFMSLSTIHPIWKYAENPFEVKKAAVVADMISGRYVTDYRARHWSKTNAQGYCQLCQITGGESTLGTLEHMLLQCPTLFTTRQNAINLWRTYTSENPELLSVSDIPPFISDIFDIENCSIKFILDPSACPSVITVKQSLGSGILSHLFYLTRTWCYMHHLRRHRLLRLYNII